VGDVTGVQRAVALGVVGDAFAVCAGGEVFGGFALREVVGDELAVVFAE